MTSDIEKMHGLLQSLANNYIGSLPWNHQSPDVRTRLAFIEDTMKKADAILNASKRPDPLCQALNEGDGVYRP